LPQPPVYSPIGLPFIELQSVDSTNNYARQQIHDGLAQHGNTIFAHEQLAGKGQRGKIWRSETSSNIILSIVIKPDQLRLMQQFQLSACVAVSVQEFFSKYAGDDTKIKWPNDLYWQDRKAGGVLIESVVRSPSAAIGLPQAKQESGVGEWLWSIIGIGININQTAFPSYLVNPVSLKQITGKNFDIITLAKELCGILDKNLMVLQKGGFEKIYSLYVSHLYKKDATVKLKKDSRVFEATIVSVSPVGKLIVRSDSYRDIEEEPIDIGFDFGEIEWVI